MKKNSSKKFKKFLFFIVIAIVFLWTLSVLVGHYKIFSAKKKYYRDFVKITDYNFNKYKQNALISVSIENLGRRLLDSVVIKIDYYDADGRLLDSDILDVLEKTKDILYPGAGKIFRIDVICPEETSDIKLSIK